MVTLPARRRTGSFGGGQFRVGQVKFGAVGGVDVDVGFVDGGHAAAAVAPHQAREVG